MRAYIARPSRADRRKVNMVHRVSTQVRFHECDLYGHVNHAVYLQYLETARVQMLRDNALSLQELQRRGINLVVRRLTIEYLRPAFLDDILEIATETARMRASSGAFRQFVTRGGERIAEATVEWACLGSDGRPTRLPQELQSLHGEEPQP
jgi:tol-pal system-associated acyl-CoA thioesterase